MGSLLLPSAKIIQLIDDETGRPVKAFDLVGEDRIAVQRLYMDLHRSRASGEDRILCALCGVPVYLCGTPDKLHYFFKHFQEDGSCPAITRGHLSEDQINALRYQGQRESKRHIRLKALLAESIEADPTFSKPVIEGTWKGKAGKEFRRPDVRSRFREHLDVAFEVQLSTTFGRVMAERELFYKRDGGLLVWIFGEFNFENDRLMMQVVFANNNRNAFVIDEETRDASLREGALMLKCRWLHPSLAGQSIIWTPHHRLVNFASLTLDQARQRAFFVDTDGQEAKLLAELAGPPLAERIEAFWLPYESFQGRERPEVPALDREWGELQQECRQHGVVLPTRHDDQFRSLMRALYSAKLGESVGWHYQGLWGVAHRIHDAHKPFLWLVVPALAHFDLVQGLEDQDHHGKWALKMSQWKEGVERGDAAYQEDHRFDGVVRLAFPELATLLPLNDAPF